MRSERFRVGKLWEGRFEWLDSGIGEFQSLRSLSASNFEEN